MDEQHAQPREEVEAALLNTGVLEASVRQEGQGELQCREEEEEQEVNAGIGPQQGQRHSRLGPNELIGEQRSRPEERLDGRRVGLFCGKEFDLVGEKKRKMPFSLPFLSESLAGRTAKGPIQPESGPGPGGLAKGRSGGG